MRKEPALDEDEDGGFAWHEDLGSGRLRALATIEWTRAGAERVVHVAGAPGAGGALLERAAGQWLVHRGDTLQDPWKALELDGSHQLCDGTPIASAGGGPDPDD